jgi:hypothetical protein
MCPDMQNPAGQGGASHLQAQISLGQVNRGEDTAQGSSDQRELARHCFLKAKALRALAGLERGAEALRIRAMAAHYSDRGRALIGCAQ